MILASASAARAALLRGAGVVVECDPADIDEAAIKAECIGSVEDAALRLADAKALRVGARRPGAWVVGADQILEIDGERLDKPRDRAEAANQLRRLRGRTHRLVSAAAVVRDGAVAWRHVDMARLNMRSFSDAFLESYLDRAGNDVLHSVGAYRLEDVGAQLFESVDGAYFTVLGLPLLPLLAFLRDQALLET